MTKHKLLLPAKYTLIINAFSEAYGVDLHRAFEMFYNSELYHEIRNGISDMHCRSDAYLADELQREINKTLQAK
jgi:hypothetical protein